MHQTIILRRSQDARAIFGNLPDSTWYEWIANGLMTPGVAIGARSVAWPDHELRALAAARINGKSEAEIKALVKNLIAYRANLSEGMAA